MNLNEFGIRKIYIIKPIYNSIYLNIIYSNNNYITEFGSNKDMLS